MTIHRDSNTTTTTTCELLTIMKLKNYFHLNFIIYNVITYMVSFYPSLPHAKKNENELLKNKIIFFF